MTLRRLPRPLSLPALFRFWMPVAMLAVLLAGPSLAERIVDDEGSDGGDRPDPKLGLMPRVETGALEFLEANPEYDGRGTVVAIFDTGVDPGAVGLQTTPDGRPKVIDIVDATGSGDVDMSKSAKVVDGKVEGLSGRTLKIPGKWKVKSVRIGVKLGYELYPQELVPRIKAHRRKVFTEQQRKLENDLRAQVAGKKGADKAEYQKRLDAAIAAGKKYSDAGPVYDCVVFQDGKVLRAAVDTDEDGDFNDEKAMTNFRVDQEWDTFDEVSLLNFGVNIYEGGKVLSIVADAHPHGTHVAGITAGYYPDQPEWNGVAPGAQIVSCKIGDTYIDGMETGKALIRAVKTVIENDCDLINMSFGEPTKSPNRGLIIRYFQEVVEKEGVIFCASAGNAGPALSTVGAPGGTSTSLIGIGAYVSPEMAKAQYALREGGRDLPYTWTSRGPTFDGDIGVNLFAPGGAIAPVPQWTLEKSMQMNGTSMASPNLCGNLALILSGLKDKKIPYNPESVKRACENTAKWIDDASPWAQGAGLIQTPAAFRALVRDKGRNSELVRLEPSVSGGKRGIYLRDIADAGQHAEPSEFRCTVGPKFHPDTKSRSKVGYRIRLNLESTADWVKCGEQITIASVPERFSVLVDPRAVEPGAHFAEVIGTDPDHPERGPLFRLPVTLLKLLPEGEDADELSLNNGWIEEEFESTPGDIRRRFFPVPQGATWADVRFHVESGDDGGRSRLFMVHAVQSVPGRTNRDGESNNFLVLEPGVEKVISFPVQPGRGMELAIAQYWSGLGSCNLHYDLTFHGIVPDQRAVNLQPGVIAQRVEVATNLQFEELAPEAKLTKYRRLVKPASASVNQLAADRDGFSGNRRFHELVLTYKITGAGAVTPYFPKVDDLLYDSEYGGFLIAVFDPNGKRVGTDDIWPHPIGIGKGEHTLKLWIRHDRRAKLDALKSMPMALERSLGSPVTLPIYPTLIAAQNGGPRFSGHWLNPDEKERFFVGNISSAPGGTLTGDVLLGSISYGKKGTHGGSGQLPGGFPLSAVVAPTQAASSAPAASAPSGSGWTWADPAPTKTDEEKLAKALRKAKLDYLKGLSIDSNKGGFNKLAEELKKDGAELPALVLTLEKLDHVAKRKTRLSAVVAAADGVLAKIDTAQIEAGLGLRPAAGDGAASKKKKDAENLKSLLVDTLYRKGRALGYMELPEVLEKTPIKDKKTHDEAFEATYKELARWDDATSLKHFLLHIRRAARKKQYGESLKWLNKYAGGPGSNYWHLEKRRQYYKALGWKHLEANTEGLLRAHFPNGKP